MTDPNPLQHLRSFLLDGQNRVEDPSRRWLWLWDSGHKKRDSATLSSIEESNRERSYWVLRISSSGNGSAIDGRLVRFNPSPAIRFLFRRLQAQDERRHVKTKKRTNGTPMFDQQTNQIVWGCGLTRPHYDHGHTERKCSTRQIMLGGSHLYVIREHMRMIYGGLRQSVGAQRSWRGGGQRREEGEGRGGEEKGEIIYPVWRQPLGAGHPKG